MRTNRDVVKKTMMMTLVLAACDDALPEVEQDGLAIVAATVSCPPGTHQVRVGGDPDGVVGRDDGAEVTCEADERCAADACGHGTCVEEGGRALCTCADGYEGAGCELCAPGYVQGSDGTCSLEQVQLSEHLALALPPPAPVAVEYGSACAGGDCAPQIPMTGKVSDIFQELDIVMRQFMKWRCVGAGVLAVSRNGRRVYKRGFGRLNGIAAGSLPGCDALPGGAAQYVEPDVPIAVGSVSKIVTAMMVRELIQQRVVERGLDADPAYDDIGGIKLTDPALDLLPDAWLDKMTGVEFYPPVTLGPDTCSRWAYAFGWDRRWEDVTIADLISHSSGIQATSADAYEDIVPQNMAAMRGYDDEVHWALEESTLLARFPEFQTKINSLRTQLRNGGNQIYFVNHYNVAGGDNPIDEYAQLFLSKCLDYNPWQTSDASPAGTSGGYSNTNYTILDRVISHLSASGRTAAEDGFPATHTGSQLDVFLAQNGIEEGVYTEEGIFQYQSAVGIPGGYVNPGPVKREWSPGQATYYPTFNDVKRPWCRWNGFFCDFSEWIDDEDKRPAWDFNSTNPVPFWASEHSLNNGQGEFAVEAPVLLKLINKYAVGNKDVLQGRLRSSCGAKCNRYQVRVGALYGGVAYAISSVPGGSRTLDLPTQSLGRLTENGAITNTAVTLPAGVDAVVAVNQWDDGKATGTATYGELDDFVNFGLSKVDWAEVDRMVAGQSKRVAGMSMNSAGNTVYWYEDDVRRIRAGTPWDHYHAALPSGANYSLPSTRIGVDILGTAIAPSNYVYTFYADGKVSIGSSTDLDSATKPYKFTLPPGQSYDDLLGIAIASDSKVHSWYRNGARASGYSGDLDYYATGTYTLPPGQTADDIVDMAINFGSDNHVWTLYRDGSISEGYSADLDYYSYTRKRPIEIEMDDEGDTHLWYANGYHKELDGTLANNLTTQTVLASDDWTLPGTRSASDVAAITMRNGVARSYYHSPLEVTYGTSEYMGSSTAAYTLPTGKLAVQFRGAAIASTGQVYSWYADNTRARGSTSDLDSLGAPLAFTAPQAAINIIGVAINHAVDDHVWVLYNDFSVSEGISTDLDYYNYWPAPAF